MHLLGNEVDANTQTSEPFLDFDKNVRGKDHDHERVSVLDYKAV